MAKAFDVPYLGAVPIDPRLLAACEAGEAYVVRHADAPGVKPFLDVATGECWYVLGCACGEGVRRPGGTGSRAPRCRCLPLRPRPHATVRPPSPLLCRPAAFVKSVEGRDAILDVADEEAAPAEPTAPTAAAAAGGGATAASGGASSA